MSNGATEKLYDLNSYTKEFTASVLSSTRDGDNFKTELSRTAFFPEGGGQYADKGVLKFGDEAAEVTDVQIEKGRIFHYTDKSIPVGTEVKGEIDWHTRFVRMQNHSGEHIISGIVHNKYGLDNIGFHLGDDDVTCDYNGDFTWEDLKQIEALANSVVFNNVEITAEYPDSEKLKTMNYRS